MKMMINEDLRDCHLGRLIVSFMASWKHVRAKVTPSLHLKYNKNRGNLGLVFICIKEACFSIFLLIVETYPSCVFAYEIYEKIR